MFNDLSEEKSKNWITDPSVDLKATAEIFKILSSKAAIRTIFILLKEPQGLCVGDLANRAHVSIWNKSHYLNKLKISGIVEGIREGQYTRYRLTDNFRKFFDKDHEMAASTKISDWLTRQMANFVSRRGGGPSV